MQWDGITYSDDFKRRVIEAHADNCWLDEIKKALDAGSLMVGRYLDDGVPQIEPDDILACKTIKEAREVANKVLARRRVYREWQDMLRR